MKTKQCNLLLNPRRRSKDAKILLTREISMTTHRPVVFADWFVQLNAKPHTCQQIQATSIVITRVCAASLQSTVLMKFIILLQKTYF